MRPRNLFNISLIHIIPLSCERPRSHFRFNSDNDHHLRQRSGRPDRRRVFGRVFCAVQVGSLLVRARLISGVIVHVRVPPSSEAGCLFVWFVVDYFARHPDCFDIIVFSITVAVEHHVGERFVAAADNDRFLSRLVHSADSCDLEKVKLHDC